LHGCAIMERREIRRGPPPENQAGGQPAGCAAIAAAVIAPGRSALSRRPRSHRREGSQSPSIPGDHLACCRINGLPESVASDRRHLWRGSTMLSQTSQANPRQPAATPWGARRCPPAGTTGGQPAGKRIGHGNSSGTHLVGTTPVITSCRGLCPGLWCLGGLPSLHYLGGQSAAVADVMAVFLGPLTD
jgi:hypothetical protein